jgi:formiminotetrahydrofolate cyclodeaminase
MALESAFLNVRINALDITDRDYVNRQLAEAEGRLARGRALCEEIRVAAEQRMQ